MVAELSVLSARRRVGEKGMNETESGCGSLKF